MYIVYIYIINIIIYLYVYFILLYTFTSKIFSLFHIKLISSRIAFNQIQSLRNMHTQSSFCKIQDVNNRLRLIKI